MSEGHGGARKGAGRKKKNDEERVRDLAVQAIKDKYGSEGEGLISLLNSGEPALMKWVFEHAMGKPKEKIDITTTKKTEIIDVDDDYEGDELDETDDENEETEDE